MHRIWILALLCFFTQFSDAALQEKTVEYRSDGQLLKGFLAWDDGISGKRPGVIVVHEWWGLNDYARSRARQLAQLGYTALALDMYGDGKAATHPADAQAFMNSVMSQSGTMKKRFLAAKSVLEQQPTVDAMQLAAIGYCFGGHVVLEMAREGVPLKAVASFHGMLGTSAPAKPGIVKAKIGVYNGADDAMVSQESITAIKQEMSDARVDFEFVNYPGAKHGFTNPGATTAGQQFNMPLAYNAAADEDSWQKLQLLLNAAFAK
jgi:dienelactone hydrolase